MVGSSLLYECQAMVWWKKGLDRLQTGMGIKYFQSTKYISKMYLSTCIKYFLEILL